MLRAYARTGSYPVIFPSLGGSGDAWYRRPQVPGVGDAARPHCHRGISPVSPIFKSPALSQ